MTVTLAEFLQYFVPYIVNIHILYFEHSLKECEYYKQVFKVHSSNSILIFKQK